MLDPWVLLTSLGDVSLLVRKLYDVEASGGFDLTTTGNEASRP